jgi:5-formyltetrahydrofolate cyclo-ligase
LAALRATRPRVAVGVAYAGQEVAQVPSAVFDQRLDAVVTERGLIPLEA